MAAIESLDTIKTFAKKLARARCIKHIIALEMTAQQLGYPHWNALTADYKKGRRGRYDILQINRRQGRLQRVLFGQQESSLV
ncbi:glyoxalase superfamily protein [Mesorhizobium sp. M0816]|uniref:glyoxalase superfamily protein n=1 Tax=Mesorhizobium sp. M0816 TaxID=2957006 RepID=UPI0033397056